MKKKVVVFGGGSGMSTLLKGLKQFPLEITSVVTVSDDGRSSGRLREEFNTPAVGDIRKVIVSLAETEPLVEKLFNYRFKSKSDLNGHPVGNLLLTATTNITGNLKEGIEALSKILNLKGKVLPLTEDNVVLKAKMEDNKFITGEEEITNDKRKIKKVYYKTKPRVNKEVIKEINNADLIILSMGSLYTSIIPTLLCKEVIDTFDKTKKEIMYISNMMTQPGETDNFSVSDHINVLNKYLGANKISVVIANDGPINKKVKERYCSLQQKDPVLLDDKILMNSKIKLKTNNYVKIEDGMLRHNVELLALDIFSYLAFKK